MITNIKDKEFAVIGDITSTDIPITVSASNLSFKRPDNETNDVKAHLEIDFSFKASVFGPADISDPHYDYSGVFNITDNLFNDASMEIYFAGTQVKLLFDVGTKAPKGKFGMALLKIEKELRKDTE